MSSHTVYAGTRVLVGLLTAAVIAGCASSNVSTETAPPVPQDRIFASALTEWHEGTVPVVFKRDTFPGHWYLISVFVNGQQVARIGNGEKLVINLPPGRYVFGVAPRYNEGVPDREIAVTVTEQYHPVLRLSLVAVGYGGWKITESSN